MNRISTLFAAAAATGLLAAPATALAADSSIIAGPLKVKGYDVTITATDSGASDSFAIMANKQAGKSYQMHMWSFTSGVKVSVKGSKATIKGSLGTFGKVDAKINAGAKARTGVPKGCTGTGGSARKGTMTGKSKFVLDTTFFKTVAPKSLKAQIVQGGKFECGGSGTPGSAKGLTLMSTLDGAEGNLMVSITKSDGKVFQQVMRTDAPGGSASVSHIISAETGASGLEAAADLSTANAAGVSPFLGGTLSFTGEGMGTMATGTVSGDFAAKFDSIGTQKLPEGNDAMLMTR
jgi:hypothetical protein